MFSLGADPEVFAVKGRKFTSVIGRFPGTKEKPFDVPGIGKLQVDNVACEFNTIPAKDANSFSKAIALPLDLVNTLLREQGLKISDKAYAKFGEDQLNCEEAMEAGCEVDYNAYEGGINPPAMLCNTQYRSAAGHVHVGLEVDRSEVPELVKFLDFFVTIPSLGVENHKRRKLYGKAGCFRYKPYGLEYRTPSNHWIFSDNRRKWMFNSVKRAIEAFRGGFHLIGVTQDVIDNNDVEYAGDLVAQFQLDPCPN